MSDFIDALCSRIFHDLASPLGAISSGIELLELSGDLTPEHALLAESASAALSRLRFFRWSFGPMGAGLIAKEDIVDVFQSVSQRITVVGLPATMAESEVKLLSLCFGACVDAKMGSATIVVSLEDDVRTYTLPDALNLSQREPNQIFLETLNRLTAKGTVATEHLENGVSFQRALAML